MNEVMISRIVKASGISAGELVLVHFWGEDGDKEIANRFIVAIASLGATPVLLQQARSINREIFSAAKESCFADRYFDLLSNFDVVLDVFAYQPVVLGYEIEEAPMALYRRYMAQLFYKLVSCKRFVQIRIPTQANAAESNLDPQDYIERMTRAYDIDYGGIKTVCYEKIKEFSLTKRVVITTGENCALHLELTGRSWHADAGDGDFPCGEIYIAPVETGTNGKVFFNTFYLNGEKYTDVTLQVSGGEIVGCSHRKIEEYFAQQPRENRIVCELGLGMNPNVTDLCGYTLLDEKMAGTFHIAVGANDMFGGANKSTCHMDFVGRGEIEVYGDETESDGTKLLF